MQGRQMKKAVIFTLGCKVNSCESAAIMQGLKERGFEVSDKLRFADLFIINTCAVTAEAEKKSRQAIARARKYNDKCKIIVTGCASQFAPQDFSDRQNVTLVTGAKSKSKLFELIDTEQTGAHLEENCADFDDFGQVFDTKERHFVKIQDGCNNFCSYCIIPHLRGRETSRSIDSIIAEIKNSSAAEVILTGINISSYDSGGGLSGLLKALYFTDKRVRLGSLEIGVIDDELLLAAKGLKDFAPHFHLSLQSGSDRVLKQMNRKYTAEDYLKKIALIRQYYENAAITTDIICGYPTESEEDFLQTLEVCRAAKFSDMHCFSYSKREGTAAAKLKELPPEIKKQRVNKALELADKLKGEYLLKNINTQLNVLFEEFKAGKSVGYSQNYLRVYADGRHSGIEKVYAKARYLDGLLGEIKG